MTAPDTASPSRDDLRLTPSVRTAIDRLPDSATASQIAGALYALHPEYASGRVVQLEPGDGPRLPTREWLARVQNLLADDDARLHGRIVILGLGRLDQELDMQLAQRGLTRELEAQLAEPLQALFRPPPAAAPPAPRPPAEEVGPAVDDEEDLAVEAEPEPEPEPAPELAQHVASAATADLPSAIDLLGFAPLVNGLRAVLDDPATKLPLAVAITGKWGAGKSSVMRQLEEELRTPPPGASGRRRWTIVRFDAWKYERSERLWAALAKAIYEQALEARGGWVARQRFRVALEWHRLGAWRFALRFAWPVLAAAAAVAVLATADLSEGGRAAGVLGVVAAAAGAVARYWRAIADPFKRAVEHHASHPDYEQHLGFTSEADRDIACLTHTVTAGPDDALAVFVDDLDRCNSAHLVEVVEAINQIFNSDERTRAPRCVFVLGLDREMVAGSIEAAYESTVLRLEKAESPMARDFGLHFIDKVVQLSVSVPRPRPDRLPALLTGVGRSGPDPDVTARIEDVRNSGEVAAAELAALRHLERNPRQAKRFHNVFRLQVYVAAAEGVEFRGNELIALARWVALRLRWPALADDLDHEPGLLELLDGAANEERLPASMTAEEQRLYEIYRRWFVDGLVTGVLLTTLDRSHRLSELPLETFLTVA